MHAALFGDKIQEVFFVDILKALIRLSSTYDKLIVANADGTARRRWRDPGRVTIALESRPADSYRHVVRGHDGTTVLPSSVAKEPGPLYHRDTAGGRIQGATELSVVGHKGRLSNDEGARQGCNISGTVASATAGSCIDTHIYIYLYISVQC